MFIYAMLMMLVITISEKLNGLVKMHFHAKCQFGQFTHTCAMQCNSANFWFEQVLKHVCELMQMEWSENNEYFAKTPFSLQNSN